MRPIGIDQVMIFQYMLIDYTTKIASLLLLLSLSCRLSCHHIFVSSYMTVIIFSIVMSVMPSWEPADALFNCTGTIPILNYCPCSHHHHHHHKKYFRDHQSHNKNSHNHHQFGLLSHPPHNHCCQVVKKNVLLAQRFKLLQ